MSKYLIEYQSEIRKLAVWSEKRLPFEPTEKLAKMRDELRLALRDMAASPSEVLLAQYYCQDNSFFDVENVLFYNVGAGAFRKASQYGLRFQRFTHLPHHPNSEFRHFQKYTFEQNLEPLIDTERPHFTIRFTIPKLNTSIKPHQIWWHVKMGFTEGDLPEDWDKNPYTLSLTISTSTPNKNWAACIKPLIDGIISTLNYQPESAHTSQAANLIAQKLNVSYEKVLSLLSLDNTGLSTLKDNLVTPYRNFIKWNPADDLCFSAELIPILTSANYVSVQASLQFS